MIDITSALKGAYDHFSARCRERGIVETDTRLLFNGISWAIGKERWDLVERVFANGEATFYRFRCPDGVYFAVVKGVDDVPVTVYDKGMLKAAKVARKKPSRRRGAYQRMWVPKGFKAGSLGH